MNLYSVARHVWKVPMQKQLSESLMYMQCRSLQCPVLPPTYEGIEFPERNKLKFVDRVPQYPMGMRPPKMMKNLKFMRGPEEIHNNLIHKQFGIIAAGPGRMRYGHFEMVRLTIGRNMDADTMFAIWRIDPPWQPITKKGQGKRMGGGKGNINHYVTPIKHGRVIVELGGKCEYKEAYEVLRVVAHNLPFPAKIVSQTMLEEARLKELELEKANTNPYTFKYIVKNNMGKCHLWISPNDRRYFGKHI